MSHRIDLIGERFGRLMVIEYDHSNKRGEPYWKCLCDCGNHVVARGIDIKWCGTSSCGCLKTDRLSECKTNDVHGQRFGRLTVIQRHGINKYGNVTWECKCDCGNVIIVSGKSLRSGNTKSCGCLFKETVVKTNKSRVGENHPLWKGGISYEPYCPLWTKELRNRIRAFFEFKCMLCDKSTEENGQQLSCHHVEYNKNACCDGKPVHFAALCRSCHSKTNCNDNSRWEAMLHRIIDEIYDGRSYYTKEEYKNCGD